MDLGKNINPVRIMIVDDHPNTATMLARVLTKFETPVDVVTASGGEEALRSVGENGVDILITDFMMPGVNGLELIERMKGEHKPAYTILITAYDTPGLAISARRLNVQKYLVKPVQPEKIRAIVEKVVKELRPETKSANASGDRRDFKILVADDNPDNLRLLSARLQNEGYSFLPAWDGQETLALIRSEAPDLVLLDVNMPKKDGFQVLEEMRADPAISHIPVIVVTAARIGPKDIRDGFALGADDYVIKPFDWRELGARIQAKLRVKQALDLLRCQNREMNILLDAGQELQKMRSLAQVSDVMLDRILDAFPEAQARVDFFENGLVKSATKAKSDPRANWLEVTREEYQKSGIGHFVLETGDGLLVDHIADDARWRSRNEALIGSALVAPIKFRGRIIGLITLTCESDGHFTKEHLSMLNSMALFTGLALENIEQEGIPQSFLEKLGKLNSFFQRLNQFTDTRQLENNLPKLLNECFGYPYVGFFAPRHDENGIIEIKSENGRFPDADFTCVRDAALRSIESGKIELVSSGQELHLTYLIPLILDTYQYGVLAVQTASPVGLWESDRFFLDALAIQLFNAFERVDLNDTLRFEKFRLSTILNSLSEAVLIIDQQKRVIEANQAGTELLNRIYCFKPQSDFTELWNENILSVLDESRTSGLPLQRVIEIEPDSKFEISVSSLEHSSQLIIARNLMQD